jgi:hypothetical protein
LQFLYNGNVNLELKRFRGKYRLENINKKKSLYLLKNILNKIKKDFIFIKKKKKKKYFFF